MEKTNKMEAIKKVAWEIIEMTEGVSVFVGAESFKKDYIDMWVEDSMTAEEISDWTEYFVKEDGSFPKGTVYLEEDGSDSDRIFILDEGAPNTELYYKNSKVKEKIDEIIDLIND